MRTALAPACLALGLLVSTPGSAAPCTPVDPPRNPPDQQSPMLVTESCDDPRYGTPVVDSDVVVAAPVPHRLIRGHFDGTPAVFAFYFPLEDPLDPEAFVYGERFYQGPTHQLRLTGEIASDAEIVHAAASGAYLVLSNPLQDYALTARDAVGGWGHPDSSGYRVDAAAAKFSRIQAQEVYGYPHRPFGYVYGGSGGAYQTATKAEWTEGVWDGFVPFVMGHPLAIPANFNIRLHAKRVLDRRDKFPCIVDATDAGGSGNPYGSCDLDLEEFLAYREALRFGFPPRSWYRHEEISGGPLFLVAAYVPLIDPGYVEDFWSKPGYLGFDDPYGSITAARIQHSTAVVAASAPIPPPDYDSLGPSYNTYMLSQYVTGPPRTVTLGSLPAGDLTGASLVMETGAAVGKFVQLGTCDTNTNTCTFGGGEDPEVVNEIAIGDQVRVDNSFYLALQTQGRHQVTNKFGRIKSYDVYRNPHGAPLYPQRDVLPGEWGAFNASGAWNTGAIRPGNKVIVVENLMDIEALAIAAEWYERRVKAALGAGTDDQFRLWFIDRARHGSIQGNSAVGVQTREVQYRGVLDQALRDLQAWAEDGVPAPASTAYQVVDGAQIALEPDVAQRGGIQPVVSLTASCGGGVLCSELADGKRVEIGIGDSVDFAGTIRTPPGTGDVVAAAWDLDEGDGEDYPAADQPAGALTPAPDVAVQHSASYGEAGTYFVTLRGTSQREGDPAAVHARIENLDRVRVVVMPEPGAVAGLLASLAALGFLRRARPRIRA